MTPPVTVVLSAALFDATQRDAAGEPVRAQVLAELGALATELGLAGPPNVRLKQGEPPRGHPVRVEVIGQVCPIPSSVPAEALAYVTGTPVATAAVDAATLVERLAGPDGTGSAQLAELVGLICRHAVATRPEVLLPENRRDTGPFTPQLDLLVEPDYLRELTTSRDGSELFAFMREGLFVELGFPPPPMHIELDRSLRPRGFAFRINGVRTLPRIGLPVGSILVNESAQLLRLRPGLTTVEATEAVMPATGRPGSITDAKHQQPAEEAGLTTWDGFGYYILALAATIRARASALMTAKRAEEMMDRLDRSYPAVVAVGRAFLPPGVLVDTLRDLLRDGVSVRNLRRIVDLLLRHDEVTREIPDGPDRIASVRAGLADLIGMKITRGGSTAVVYLLDPVIEDAVAQDRDGLGGELAERLADTVQAELGRLPENAQVAAVLTEERYRRAVRELLQPEFPQLSVISYADLPANVNVQPQARISWR